MLRIILVFSMALVPIIGLRYHYNRFSLQVCGGGFLILLILWGGLRAYSAKPSFLVRSADTGRSIAVGLYLGLLWVIEISINNFLSPPLPGRDIVDNLFWAGIAVGLFLFAALCAYRADHLRVGVEAGTWTGLASGAVACCMALALTVFGMKSILGDPINLAEWADRGPRTGAPSMAAYFAYETFAGAFLHLIVLGIVMGVLLGLIGGATGKGMRLVCRLARHG